MHLALWYVLLVCHQYDVCENSVGSVYVGGYGGLSESGLLSSVNCVQSVVMSYVRVDHMDDKQVFRTPQPEVYRHI